MFKVKLAQSWIFCPEDQKHFVNLYHDTVSGVRSVTIDFMELPSADGTSSMMMGSAVHRMNFELEDRSGYVEIKKSGMTSFAYKCVIDNAIVSEASKLFRTGEVLFAASVCAVLFTSEEAGDDPVAWYALEATRISDDTTTTVHR